MKKSVLFVAIFVSAIAIITNSFAQAPPDPVSAEKSVIIEGNYLAGLESDNQGIKVSSAFFLGDAGSDRAVIPLLKMLNEEDPGEKFVAAWSLLKIGDKRGVYRVKMESERSDSEYMRVILDYLYKDFCFNKYGRVL